MLTTPAQWPVAIAVILSIKMERVMARIYRCSECLNEHEGIDAVLRHAGLFKEGANLANHQNFMRLLETGEVVPLVDLKGELESIAEWLEARPSMPDYWRVGEFTRWPFSARLRDASPEARMAILRICGTYSWFPWNISPQMAAEYLRTSLNFGWYEKDSRLDGPIPSIQTESPRVRLWALEGKAL